MIRFWPDGSVSVENENDLALLLKQAPHLLARPNQEQTKPKNITEPERPAAVAPSTNGTHVTAKRLGSLSAKHDERLERIVKVLSLVRDSGPGGITVAKLAKAVGVKPLGLNGVIMKVSVDTKGLKIERDHIYKRIIDKGRKSVYHPGPRVQHMIDHYNKELQGALN